MSIASPHSGPLPQLRPPLHRRPWPYVTLVAVLVAGLVGWRIRGASVERVELPVIATVPPFEFVDHHGQPFGAQALQGKVWVANFIFTRCPNVCPKFTAKMATLDDKSAAAPLTLVSFTVDPENDTPEVLATYAHKYGASDKWHFVRGDRPELERVVKEGMLQPLEAGDGIDLNTVVHSSYLTLVDGQRRVRGIYRFTDPSSVDQVLRDAAILTDL